MTETEIREGITGILVQDFAKGSAIAGDGDSTLRGDLGMDSLDVVDLVFFIKQSFGVDVRMEEYRDLHTTDKLVAFVEKKQG